MARRGYVWRSKAARGKSTAPNGRTPRQEGDCGSAWRCVVRRGQARFGEAMQGLQWSPDVKGMALRGKAWRCAARHSKDLARRSNVWCGEARHGKAR